MHVDELLRQLQRELGEIADAEERQKNTRTGSRFVGPGADPEYVEHVGKGGSFGEGGEFVPKDWTPVEKSVRMGERRREGLLSTMGKALAEGSGSSGGYLVAPDVSLEVVRMLRARSAVMRCNPTMVNVKKELDVTSLSTGATAFYTAENAQIPVSEQTFAQSALLRPKDLTAMVPVSLRLIKDAQNPSVEAVVRQDLAEVLALRQDLAFLRGTGTGGEPTGIKNTAGLTAAPSLGANGATPTFDDLKNMVANIRAVNGPFFRPSWIFNPRLLSTLEKVKDTTNRYLADSGLLTFDPVGGSGTLLGTPFYTTSQIPTNITTGSSSDTTEIYFSSDWEECWVGIEQALQIDVSTEASYWDGSAWINAYQNKQCVLRAMTTHDVALRRPQLFSVMTGVRP
jgi:HK97 family phage major capsid protein